MTVEKVSFGPFTVEFAKRELTREGITLPVGSRAFDLLVVLLSKPQEIFHREELLQKVWPDVNVGDGSLRFHMSQLRKVLGENGRSERYIRTIAGRGYCFVASLTTEADDGKNYYQFIQALPRRTVHLFGREHEISSAVIRLPEVRLLSFVGMGGVGKTSVAVAVAHAMLGIFGDSISFVDIGTLSDEGQIAPTIAATLGLQSGNQNAALAIKAHLGNRPSLIVLDTCEAAIDATAQLVSFLLDGCKNLCFLVTSREPLGIQSEFIVRLHPLVYPSDSWRPSHHPASAFPAVAMFLQRVAAIGGPIDLNSEEAMTVVEICRAIEGVPLAIELAAGRVGTLGLHATKKLLGEKLNLLQTGRRDVPARQRTLQATLDWSYNLLSPHEKLVLCRLTIFRGHFTIEAALAITTNELLNEVAVIEAISSLVLKSMITSNIHGKSISYHLLDTTRNYAGQIYSDHDEINDISRRHAEFYAGLLSGVDASALNTSDVDWRTDSLGHLGNIRAALQWSFGDNGDKGVGIALASASAKMLIALSLLEECQTWMECALAALQACEHERSAEAGILASLGVSLMFSKGGQQKAHDALEKSLVLSATPEQELRALGPLQMFSLRTGNYLASMRYANRCLELAKLISKPQVTSLAHALAGISLHLRGEQQKAREALEVAVKFEAHAVRERSLPVGFDDRLFAGAVLARTLWLQGFPEEAQERAELTILEAEALGHPLTLSITLVWAATVSFWAGNLERAQVFTYRLLECARSYSLVPYIAVAQGFSGIILTRQGDGDKGRCLLRRSLTALRSAPYELLTTSLTLALVENLYESEHFEEAIQLVEPLIDDIKVKGDLCYLPEAIRMKACLYRVTKQSAERVNQLLEAALQISREQGSHAWEVRIMEDLVRVSIEAGSEVTSAD